MKNIEINEQGQNTYERIPDNECPDNNSDFTCNGHKWFNCRKWFEMFGIDGITVADILGNSTINGQTVLAFRRKKTVKPRYGYDNDGNEIKPEDGYEIVPENEVPGLNCRSYRNGKWTDDNASSYAAGYFFKNLFVQAFARKKKTTDPIENYGYMVARTAEERLRLGTVKAGDQYKDLAGNWCNFGVRIGEKFGVEDTGIAVRRPIDVGEGYELVGLDEQMDGAECFISEWIEESQSGKSGTPRQHFEKCPHSQIVAFRRKSVKYPRYWKGTCCGHVYKAESDSDIGSFWNHCKWTMLSSCSPFLTHANQGGYKELTEAEAMAIIKPQQKAWPRYFKPKNSTNPVLVVNGENDMGEYRYADGDVIERRAFGKAMDVVREGAMIELTAEEFNQIIKPQPKFIVREVAQIKRGFVDGTEATTYANKLMSENPGKKFAVFQRV